MIKKVGKNIKKFWKFLNEDSWPSTFVFMILSFLVIYFILIPLIALITGTTLTLVIVESCSMYHQESLEGILENNLYAQNNISIEDTENWSFKKGFTKGDIIFSIAPKNLEVGDVIIFDSGNPRVRYPIIHRIIRAGENFTTKGDNNPGLLEYEREIQEERILAKSVFRIPHVGWIKLIFFDWQKSPEQRGFC